MNLKPHLKLEIHHHIKLHAEIKELKNHILLFKK